MGWVVVWATLALSAVTVGFAWAEHRRARDSIGHIDLHTSHPRRPKFGQGQSIDVALTFTNVGSRTIYAVGLSALEGTQITIHPDPDVLRAFKPEASFTVEFVSTRYPSHQVADPLNPGWNYAFGPCVELTWIDRPDPTARRRGVRLDPGARVVQYQAFGRWRAAIPKSLVAGRGFSVAPMPSSLLRFLMPLWLVRSAIWTRQAPRRLLARIKDRNARG
jgi:hypothetical protein